MSLILPLHVIMIKIYFLCILQPTLSSVYKEHRRDGQSTSKGRQKQRKFACWSKDKSQEQARLFRGLRLCLLSSWTAATFTLGRVAPYAGALNVQWHTCFYQNLFKLAASSLATPCEEGSQGTSMFHPIAPAGGEIWSIRNPKGWLAIAKLFIYLWL